LTASYKVLNNEPASQYTFGWTIIRENGNIDVTNDVIKTYYQTSILKVHLDNKIIEANNYYNVTFYVKGNSRYYKSMQATKSIRIFFGIPPTPGKCAVDVSSGYATITPFTFNASGWTDTRGIKQYNFYYSFDNGDIYVPLYSSDITSQNMTYTFNAVYQDTQVKIKCEVVNILGFKNSLTTSIYLMKRSNANS
jgi:hypothetical protein